MSQDAAPGGCEPLLPSASPDHAPFRRGGILAGKNEHHEQDRGSGEIWREP